MNVQTIRVLNKLKNSSLVHQKCISAPINKLTRRIISLLYKEGYILSYKRRDDKDMKIELKRYTRIPIFKNLKLCSSPSKAVFLSFKQIIHLNTKKNLYILSTNKGIMTGNSCKALKLGGVLLFYC